MWASAACDRRLASLLLPALRTAGCTKHSGGRPLWRARSCSQKASLAAAETQQQQLPLLLCSASASGTSWPQLRCASRPPLCTAHPAELLPSVAGKMSGCSAAACLRAQPEPRPSRCPAEFSDASEPGVLELPANTMRQLQEASREGPPALLPICLHVPACIDRRPGTHGWHSRLHVKLEDSAKVATPAFSSLSLQEAAVMGRMRHPNLGALRQPSAQRALMPSAVHPSRPSAHTFGFGAGCNPRCSARADPCPSPCVSALLRAAVNFMGLCMVPPCILTGGGRASCGVLCQAGAGVAAAPLAACRPPASCLAPACLLGPAASYQPAVSLRPPPLSPRLLLPEHRRQPVIALPIPRGRP